MLAAAGLPLMGGCVYRPLYGADSYAPDSSAALFSQIRVADVDTRVAQQVRNHLIFLLHGGRGAAEPRYEVYLRVSDHTQLYAANRDFGGTTAGAATITVSYDLVELPTRRQIASGRRVGSAYYDRTGQSFANDRAQRDAANRAAQDAAEQVRMAIAADFAKL